jgi:hypothetical protein
MEIGEGTRCKVGHATRFTRWFFGCCCIQFIIRVNGLKKTCILISFCAFDHFGLYIYLFDYLSIHLPKLQLVQE